jgi:hypothetical protein
MNTTFGAVLMLAHRIYGKELAVNRLGCVLLPQRRRKVNRRAVTGRGKAGKLGVAWHADSQCEDGQTQHFTCPSSTPDAFRRG